MTNAELCGILERLSREWQRDWSLKIEQQKRERKASVIYHTKRISTIPLGSHNHGDCEKVRGSPRELESGGVPEYTL